MILDYTEKNVVIVSTLQNNRLPIGSHIETIGRHMWHVFAGSLNQPICNKHYGLSG